MTAGRELYLRFFINSSIMMVLALAGLNPGFSMTIPLEKGNVWKYSYSIHQLTDTSVGRFSLSVDSIVTHSGQNDTTFFWLAIIDSGITYDTLSSHYQLSYSKHFYAYHDNIFFLDTFTSPGFNNELLFFYRIPDTSALYMGIDSWSYSRRTDSTSITVETQQFEAFSMIIDESLRHTSPSTSYGTKTNKTFQWINRIGTAYYSENQESESWGTTNMTTSRTYTLESFNGIPIPQIPISTIKAGQLAKVAARPMVALNKIVYIKNSVPKTVFDPKTIYFNLHGQKLNRPMGGQLLLQELHF